MFWAGGSVGWEEEGTDTGGIEIYYMYMFKDDIVEPTYTA
jgi:hypothetical protein